MMMHSFEREKMGQSVMKTETVASFFFVGRRKTLAWYLA